MKIILIITYVLCASLSFIFGILGWQANAGQLFENYRYLQSVVIPGVFGFGTIILPFYINPVPQMAEWLKRQKELKSAAAQK